MPNPTYPHYALTGGKLHPPIYSNTAATKYTGFTNGTSISLIPETRGQVYFHNLSTPVTVTNPTAYAVIGGTWVASGLAYRMTEHTSGYLQAVAESAGNRGMHIAWSVTLDHNDAGSQDVYVSLAPNGSTSGSERTQLWATLAPSVKKTFTGVFEHVYSYSNFLQLAVKIGGGTGDVRVYHAHLVITPTTV